MTSALTTTQYYTIIMKAHSTTQWYCHVAALHAGGEYCFVVFHRVSPYHETVLQAHPDSDTPDRYLSKTVISINLEEKEIDACTDR